MRWFKKKALEGALKKIKAGHPNGFPYLTNALQVGADPNAHLSGGLTPLMLCCFLEDGMLAAKILREYGADPLVLDRSGSFNAIQFAQNQGCDGLAETLEMHSNVESLRSQLLGN
ncbi:hypothetical protein [Thalassospira permensis]|uniref:Ankyrin n=1 Tax=Thalassospira permensis NBRC 106175 TaxID=1353532 RepID=A0ABR4TKF0_9PROT|nr:hypothetical protein [Thalassospira permensis]KEO50426.1 hypothetical protein SMB34_10705 [Thalassospira permensis NBRC 106175]